MIRNIDNITINGVKKIWNGYIFNVDYQPSFGQTPSYLTLNFVSEDGTYSISENDLQILSPYQINLGANIPLQMYPVRYKISKGSSGKLLEVRFIDTSIALDKVIVVLNGRQGNDGTTFPINPALSSSGTQAGNSTGSSTTGTPTSNPTSPKTAQISSSGVITTSGGTTNTTDDPNSDLSFYPNDKGYGSCYIPLGQELFTVNDTFNNVLQVVYNFAQLCDGIGVNGIPIAQDSFALIQNSNQNYFASYIGTLRGVLSQWCTDLAYGFYWENNMLHFIDLTTTLTLNTSVLDAAVQEANTEEVSIEDTIGRVSCAFFGQDQQAVNISPAQDTELSFKQVTLTICGYTSDQIAAVKAAFLGETFFYAYHFFLGINDNFGKLVLGMSTVSSMDNSPTSQALDYDGANKVYQQYYYSSIVESIAKNSYDAYRTLTGEIGAYFYKPMTRGDYHQLSGWDKGLTVGWFKQDLPVGLTPLGVLATCDSSKTNETLNDFLLGESYVPPTPIGSPDDSGNNEATGNTGILPSSSNNDDDNDDGVCIIYIPKTSWQILNNGTLINATPDSVGTYLQENSYLDNLAVPFDSRSDPTFALEALDSSKGGAGVLNDTQNNSYDLQLWGVKSATDLTQQKVNFDGIKTPEDLLGPDQSFKCVITDPGLEVIPKIEEYFRSETDKTGDTVNCKSDVIKNEMNFRNITNADLTALGNPPYSDYLGPNGIYNIYGIYIPVPAIPTPANLEIAFKDFSQDLTYSKIDPTIIRTYSLPYIDLPNDYQPLIGDGLMNLKISIGDKGVTTEFTMGTRFMQVPSLESIRMNLEFQRHTNESRFIPYGYNSFNF